MSNINVQLHKHASIVVGFWKHIWTLIRALVGRACDGDTGVQWEGGGVVWGTAQTKVLIRPSLTRSRGGRPAAWHFTSYALMASLGGAAPELPPLW